MGAALRARLAGAVEQGELASDALDSAVRQKALHGADRGPAFIILVMARGRAEYGRLIQHKACAIRTALCGGYTDAAVRTADALLAGILKG